MSPRTSSAGLSSAQRSDPVHSLFCDDAASRIYLLSNTTLGKLLFLDSATDFVTQTYDLSGTPKQILSTGSVVVVLVMDSGKYYTKSFLKSDIL